MENLKIGLAQMTSVDDVEQNMRVVMDLLNSLSYQQVDAVFFPENCLYMRLREGDSISGFNLEDRVFADLLMWSRNSQIAIHLGSVPLRVDSVLYNSSVWISPSGGVEASYMKTHLFDIDLEGQKPIRESDVFSHGLGPQVLNLKKWNLGQSICYDIRFSDLYHAYAALGVEAITIPAAFLVKTGQAHWEVLLRARAIESQCYIIASAQSGLHQTSSGMRETYGHSLVVDPWGHKILELLDSPSLGLAELNLSEVHKVRRQIPMKNHRRGPFKASIK